MNLTNCAIVQCTPNVVIKQNREKSVKTSKAKKAADEKKGVVVRSGPNKFEMDWVEGERPIGCQAEKRRRAGFNFGELAC